MNLILYYVLLLVSCVLGSELNTEIVQNPEESEIEPETEDPELIKQNFMTAVKSANVADCKEYAEKYDFLTDKFNRDIFSELIQCFEAQDEDETCWELFEIFKPSYFNVSRSTTTPVILALRRNKMELFTALAKLEGIDQIIDKTDEFDRTALMYAAKRGSYFAVRFILQISAESVNFKDFLGKTAIHYACEMIPQVDNDNRLYELPAALTGEIDAKVSNKLAIVDLLMSYNGLIFQNGPEYKLAVGDKKLREIISEFYGNIVIQQPTETAMLRAINALILSGVLHGVGHKFLEIILANPAFIYLNKLCSNLMQFLFPDMDANLVFSIKAVDGIQVISFNLLFILLTMTAFEYVSNNYLRKTNSKPYLMH